MSNGVLSIFLLILVVVLVFSVTNRLSDKIARTVMNRVQQNKKEEAETERKAKKKEKPTRITAAEEVRLGGTRNITSILILIGGALAGIGVLMFLMIATELGVL